MQAKSLFKLQQISNFNFLLFMQIIYLVKYHKKFKQILKIKKFSFGLYQTFSNAKIIANFSIELSNNK